MSTTQVRITIPNKLKTIIEEHAAAYGLSIASYIKQLVVEEIRRRETYPSRTPSEMTIKAIRKGDKEFKSGKVKVLPLDDLKHYAEDV
ncbi:MAG: hypothetical protein UV73_C0005G0025 [Candidatus Gottesmanbacteria bacterium GW2011_GWA2_43_14]|uniref:Uncharacterized protein n=1 Tax=Candidatus Gottesmanbacteria bacterium GW2011_GWA2_43_14 TaxID=1618443 RepID=A0A0G1GFZ5_9BACT|nr:MAG: hypothetical protein UV73_C0005G0025 [Candidatus Gottesmanbacteria bacterium GW2011_GWA2_43_14]